MGRSTSSTREREQFLALVDACGDEQALVFSAPDGAGPVRHSNVYRRHYKPAVTRCGLPRMHFHDLRHSYAAIMIQNGASPRLLMKRLGHESVKTTLDTYGHIFPEAETESTEKLDAAFFAVHADRS